MARERDAFDDIPFEIPIAGRQDRARAARVYDALSQAYPDARCELNFSSPHELLVATILSAQATDAGVNKATPALFRAFQSPAAFASAGPEAIEPWIRTIGLFRTKARAVHESMHAIVRDFRGEVPRTMGELLTLRGVARKTANVVLSNGFGIHVGIAVDTHVARVSVRLGLVEGGLAVGEIEKRLMGLYPSERWGRVSHLLIFHGRRACAARRRACADHPVCRRYGSCCELSRG